MSPAIVIEGDRGSRVSVMHCIDNSAPDAGQYLITPLHKAAKRPVRKIDFCGNLEPSVLEEPLTTELAATAGLEHHTGFVVTEGRTVKPNAVKSEIADDLLAKPEKRLSIGRVITRIILR